MIMILTVLVASKDVASWVKEVASIVSAVLVIAGLFWWLVKPRVQAWVKEQLIQPVQETHRSVTVNGGRNSPPTLRDEVSELRAAATRAVKVGERNAEQMEIVRSVVEKTREDLRETRHDMQEHGDQSRAAMTIYRRALSDQGIHLPVAPGEDGYGV